MLYVSRCCSSKTQLRGGARLLQVLPIVQSLVHEAGQTNSLQVCMSKTLFLVNTHASGCNSVTQLEVNALQICSISFFIIVDAPNFTGKLQITASTPLNNLLNNKTHMLRLYQV